MIYFNHPSTELLNWGPWIHGDLFTPGECKNIIRQMRPEKMLEAKVDTNGVDNKLVRSALICGLEFNSQNNWIFERLQGFILQANLDVYKMNLHGFNEAVQLMSYKPGDHYDWHMDSGNKQFSLRKLSVSVQLTSPSEYEGGELEFFNNGKAPTTQGSIILFPSYMYHRVLSVTAGERRALVAWVHGNPYK